VDQPARALATAFCADEYLDFDIKGRMVRLSTLEEQLTVAMLAVHGWQRFNEVAHMLPPSFDMHRNERGTLKRVPAIAISAKIRRVDLALAIAQCRRLTHRVKRLLFRCSLEALA
jgi:hypothetical protein